MKKVFRMVCIGLVVLAAGGFLIQLVRQAQAAAQIEREWETPASALQNLGNTRRLEIIPLYEEAGDSSVYATGHGVSYLVRTDEATLLVDVGNNPEKLERSPFLTNMEKLGIDWEEIDAIVISHPHPDHIGGLDAWLQGRVLFGSRPEALSTKLIYEPVLLKSQNMVTAQDPEPKQIAVGVATIGVLGFPDMFPFSLRDPKGSEQSLVVNVDGRGLVLITSCGHATLEKMVTRAEAVTGLPVIGVVGGLHYEDLTAGDVQPQIDLLAARQPQLVALSPHDSSPAAIEAFRAAFPGEYRYLRVGETIHLP